MMFEFAGRPKKRCPHEDVQHCPLYVASNGAGGGCDDGGLAEMRCAVDARKINYNRAVARLSKADRALVNDCAMREMRSRSKAQRERNMRMNGIH